MNPIKAAIISWWQRRKRHGLMVERRKSAQARYDLAAEGCNERWPLKDQDYRELGEKHCQELAESFATMPVDPTSVTPTQDNYGLSGLSQDDDFPDERVVMLKGHDPESIEQAVQQAANARDATPEDVERQRKYYGPSIKSLLDTDE